MDRPDLLREAEGRIGKTERFQIRFIRKTFEPGPTDRTIRWLQRTLGSTWIRACLTRTQ